MTDGRTAALEFDTPFPSLRSMGGRGRIDKWNKTFFRLPFHLSGRGGGNLTDLAYRMHFCFPLFLVLTKRKILVHTVCSIFLLWNLIASSSSSPPPSNFPSTRVQKETKNSSHQNKEKIPPKAAHKRQEKEEKVMNA